MGLLAIVGGSGAARLEALLGRADAGHVTPDTPFGPPSAPVQRGRLGGRDVLFLPRHGHGHRFPPHRINYRANLWALRSLGADRVVGLGAVGGIGAGLGPRVFAVPDQVIDYTYGRDHTFHDGAGDTQPGPEGVVHVDFTEPYCRELRVALIAACSAAGVPAVERATYAATQGPRLESAAEIARLERDGCHVVGMTGMPEASLARELGLCYACLAFVVNWGAGKGEGAISMDEISAHLDHCMDRVADVLEALARAG